MAPRTHSNQRVHGRPRLPLGPGSVLSCQKCETQLVVLASAKVVAHLSCSGQKMIPTKAMPCSAASVDRTGPTGMVAGGRYGDEDTGLVVRCTQAGIDEPLVDGRRLTYISSGLSSRR